MIGIINYGVGNLKSVKNSLNFLRIKNRIIEHPRDLASCDKIILPGVGAFGAAMKKLQDLKFASAIQKFAQSGKPVLGICLGMQLLFDEGSEHGRHQGLGLISGKVNGLAKKVKNLPLPLIGWNSIIKERPSPLLKDIDDGASFYFVHSFYCEPKDKQVTLANAEYGIKFAAMINHQNIFGCQFHPEKSQKFGLQILKNFAKI